MILKFLFSCAIQARTQCLRQLSQREVTDSTVAILAYRIRFYLGNVAQYKYCAQSLARFFHFRLGVRMMSSCVYLMNSTVLRREPNPNKFTRRSRIIVIFSMRLSHFGKTDSVTESSIENESRIFSTFVFHSPSPTIH